jgi:hypothetical protein
MVSPPSQPRPGLVSLVLLGVLLLTVGGAWLVVRFYFSASREGAVILEDMRKQGLHALWPQKRYVARFARKAPGGAVLARITSTRQPSAGAFGGTETFEAASTAVRETGNVKETWAVSDDLTEADYRADYFTRSFSVRIVLNKGRVSFQGSNMAQAVATDAPANYMPEGLESLVVRQVAQRGTKASFQSIANENSFGAKNIVMLRMKMIPVSRQEVRCEVSGGASSYEITFHLDAAGEVTRIDYPDGSFLTPLPTGKTSLPEAPPPAKDPNSPEEPAGEAPDTDPLVMAS